jgi:curved DNA-binding protein CbpA
MGDAPVDPRFTLVTRNLDKLDYYALFGLRASAKEADIRDAFHRFALLFHPDRYVDDPERRAAALPVFKRGTEAYRVLKNSLLRARYDKVLGSGRLRLNFEEMTEVVVGGATEARREPPLPAPVQALHDQAVQALERGDVNGATMMLQLARGRSNAPALEALAQRIAAARSGRR